MNKNKKIDQNIGAVFNLLRKSRKLTQTEAAKGVMSATELSSFENGKVMPGADKVFRLLSNINVTLLEFQDEYNTYLGKSDILLYDDAAISNAYFSQDFGKLETILEEIKNQIKHAPDILKYKLDKGKVEAIMEVINPSFQVPQEDKELIKDYLLRLKSWRLYDLLLFDHCLNFFEFGSFLKIIDRLTKFTGKNLNIPSVKRAFIQTCLTAIDTCILQKYYPLAEELVEFLTNFRSSDYNMYENLTLKYNKVKLGYLTGKIKKSSAFNEMNKCRDALLFCDCPNTANLIQREIEALDKLDVSKQEQT
ncbi:Rgg/GadR/MutR family transcriptional regulator [Lactovum odontotermitis]